MVGSLGPSRAWVDVDETARLAADETITPRQIEQTVMGLEERDSVLVAT
jgi:hypothetical protein